jgi:hypothetical protein
MEPATVDIDVLKKKVLRLEDTLLKPSYLTLKGFQSLNFKMNKTNWKSQFYSFLQSIDIPQSWIFDLYDPWETSNTFEVPNIVYIYFVSHHIKKHVEKILTSYFYNITPFSNTAVC